MLSFVRQCSGIASSTSLKNFCLDMKRRGLISLILPDNFLDSSSKGGYDSQQLPNVLYAGFDPTASSFHVGNLLILTSLFRSSLMGCSPIALIGGATALIGDPSGRIKDRPELSREFVNENSECLTKQLQNMWRNLQAVRNVRNDKNLIILNNIEWYNNMSVIEFLRLARCFRISEMLRMGHVKSRLGENQGLSYTEFSYQVLQSYDWYFLSQNYDCYFQLGGSDQLGHIHSGYDYIKRRAYKSAAGICMPLVTNDDGSKLGKSTMSNEASVWLDKKKTSPYAFYQYFRQLHDDIAARLLVYFSLRPFEEIESILEKHNANLGAWIAQTELATELTQLVHGKEGLEMAQRCTNILFRGSLDDFKLLDPIDVEELFGKASTFSLKRDTILTAGDLARKSRTDRVNVENLMKSGAFKVNGKVFNDPNERLNFDEIILIYNLSLICWGKRKFCLVKWI